MFLQDCCHVPAISTPKGGFWHCRVTVITESGFCTIERLLSLGVQVVEAGAVAALMQLQSLAYQGPFRDDACRQLAHLAATHPKVGSCLLSVPPHAPR